MHLKFLHVVMEPPAPFGHRVSLLLCIRSSHKQGLVRKTSERLTSTIDLATCTDCQQLSAGCCHQCLRFRQQHEGCCLPSGVAQGRCEHPAIISSRLTYISGFHADLSKNQFAWQDIDLVRDDREPNKFELEACISLPGQPCISLLGQPWASMSHLLLTCLHHTNLKQSHRAGPDVRASAEAFTSCI